jgi:AMMECR1 domain-containing protein
VESNAFAAAFSDPRFAPLSAREYREIEVEVSLLSPTQPFTIVPGATHLFEEPGTLEQAAGHAARWFVRYLAS